MPSFLDHWHYKRPQSLVSDQSLALQSNIDSPPEAPTEGHGHSPLFEQMASFLSDKI